MASIFQVDEHDVPWVDYRDRNGEPDGPAAIRFKALSLLGADVPSLQYVDYAPGYVDPVHSHDTGEWLIITGGSLRVGEGDDEPVSGPGAAVFVPKDTPYAVHAGEKGARFFRVVVP